jgi:hypothetical protein
LADPQERDAEHKHVAMNCTLAPAPKNSMEELSGNMFKQYESDTDTENFGSLSDEEHDEESVPQVRGEVLRPPAKPDGRRCFKNCQLPKGKRSLLGSESVSLLSAAWNMGINATSLLQEYEA